MYNPVGGKLFFTIIPHVLCDCKDCFDFRHFTKILFDVFMQSNKISFYLLLF